MTNCYALYLPISFPEGLAAGAGSDYNMIQLARDGKNRLILRGTSLAGALRHTYSENNGEINEKRFFGTAEGDQLYRGQSSSDKPSLLETPDCILEFNGKSESSGSIRTHHLRNRHTGTVLDQGLFSIQSCLPKTECGCVLWLNPSESSDAYSDKDALDFLGEIASFFNPATGGLLLGGNAARGIGRAILKENTSAKLAVFDLSNSQQYEQYLKTRRELIYAESIKDISKITTQKAWEDFRITTNWKERLTVQFTLTIPRGQDILIADGQGTAAGMEPQRVTMPDGKTFWRIPGSTLRGLFRSSMTRFAARAGKPIADAAELYEQRAQKNCQKDQAYNGSNLAWAFVEQQQRKNTTVESCCSIVNLFGSAFKKGRIHFSDSFALCTDEYSKNAQSEVEQYRVHLKIDPISSGNADGALFNNTVLTSASNPSFNIVMYLENPSKEECSWIAATLRALDAGVLRVGSSKASGRMSLVGPIHVNGQSWKIENEDILQFFNARNNDIVPDNQAPKQNKVETAPVTPKSVKSYIAYVQVDWKNRNKPLMILRYDNPAQKPTNEVPTSELKQFKPQNRVRVFVDENNKFVRIEAVPLDNPAIPSATTSQSDDKKNSKNHDSISADKLGAPFFNPYTFIPFTGVPFRKDKPTLQSADEIERERVSGYIDLEVETLRPLMSLFPIETNKEANNPKRFRALTIGNDVIVPSTAIRGAMRNLMMILTGGALGNLNPNSYACQGRDCQLGPANPKLSPKKAENVPKKAFLAKVISPGNANKNGIIRIGKCYFVQRDDLVKLYVFEQRLINEEAQKQKNGQHLQFQIHNGRVKIATSESSNSNWELKLSGRPIIPLKREALYQEDPSSVDLVIPAEKWLQYSSRNVTGEHPTLYRGDLIWIEHVDKNGNSITKSEEVKSLQWARWGKTGDRLFDLVKPEFRPDTYRKDKNVDWVTDLFGQVSDTGDKELPAFSGRIRPENLVFEGAKFKCYKNVQLVPLSMPHPGCIGFYRDRNNKENDKLLLRGYKVYRNAKEGEEPWKYDVQGIYNDTAELKDFNATPKMNRIVELISEKTTGRLRIAFHALNQQELGILYCLCTTVWRLGGGKPLGLGLCATKNVRVFLLNEDGSFEEDKKHEFAIDSEMSKRLTEQTKYWEASQKAVPNMRYPRAISKNSNKLNRGGHVWFTRHAKPKSDNKNELESLDLNKKPISNLILSPGIQYIEPQWLPDFDLNSNDCLFGYDLLSDSSLGIESDNKMNLSENFEPFNPDKHITGNEKSEGNHSLNRETREQEKKKRGNRADE